VRFCAGGAPPVNILILDQFSAMGGAQQCLADLLPALADRGWTARAALPPGGPLIDLFRNRGIEVDEIPCGPYRNGKKSLGDVLQFAADVPSQVSTISRLLKETHLVYVNGPRLLVAAAIATRGRIPILFHAHHQIGQRGAAYLEGMALRHSNTTVAACCDAVALPLRPWVPRDRVHTIPNGTLDFGFRQRRFGKELRIGIIGRIAPEKGQTEFLRAASTLVEHVPHARFVVCGAPLFGDRSYYKEVLSLARNLPVEFLDWQQDVAAVMCNLDILVIASTQEGMPRVLLEAFSAGLPVVAFPVGGIPEVIEDGVTGFLTTDLAAKLREVADSTRLPLIAKNARHEWERRYTVATYRERVTDLIEQCLQNACGETKMPRRRRSATPQPALDDTRSE
jgi:glycosyltransferase involved in cell wall biosynthesis